MKIVKSAIKGWNKTVQTYLGGLSVDFIKSDLTNEWWIHFCNQLKTSC